VGEGKQGAGKGGAVEEERSVQKGRGGGRVLFIERKITGPRNTGKTPRPKDEKKREGKRKGKRNGKCCLKKG